jgi:hypothetical protein
MSLKIIVPDDLDRKSETYLLAALQDSGTRHISGNEWRSREEALSSEEFLAKLRASLPEPELGLADRLTITICRPLGPCE